MIQERVLKTCTPSECDIDENMVMDMDYKVSNADGSASETMYVEKEAGPVRLRSQLRDVFLPKDGGLITLVKDAFDAWREVLKYSICVMAAQNYFFPVRYHNLVLSLYGILFNMLISLQARKGKAVEAITDASSSSGEDVNLQPATA